MLDVLLRNNALTSRIDTMLDDGMQTMCNVVALRTWSPTLEETRALPEAPVDLGMQGLRNYRVVDLFRSREVNTDGDDLLSTDELLTVLESMHLNLNKSDLRMVVDYMDADSSGDIDVDELSAAMRWARRNSAPRDAMNQIAAVCRANPASDILMLTTRTAKRKGKAAEEHARMQQRAMQR